MQMQQQPLGLRLQAWRQTLGWSREATAARCRKLVDNWAGGDVASFTADLVSRWERGQRPTDREMLIISTVYLVPFGELLIQDFIDHVSMQAPPDRQHEGRTEKRDLSNHFALVRRFQD